MLDREGLSGAAHAGHDFVGYEEDVVLAANFRDALHVTVGRSGSAERGSDDRLENESGDGFGVVCGEERIEIAGTSNVAAGEIFIEGTVITEARCDVAPFGEKWLVGSTASDIAADRHRAERTAVVALTAGYDTEFLRRVGFEMELAREFDGGFGGFGAAGSEIDATVRKI